MPEVLENLRRRSSELTNTRAYADRSKAPKASGLRTGIWGGPALANFVYFLGVLEYFSDIHLRVDAIGGSELAAIPPAYFLAGQMEHLKKFVLKGDIRSLIHWRDLFPVLDICRMKDVLEGGVPIQEIPPLNIARIKRSTTAFKVGATNITGRVRGELLDVKGPGQTILDPILATNVVPTKDSPPVVIGSQSYVAGALTMSLPLLEFSEKALPSGEALTDILVVLSEPKIAHRKARHPRRLWQKVRGGLAVRPFKPTLIKTFFKHHALYEEQLAFLGDEVLENGCRVKIIAPTRSQMIRKTTTNQDVLAAFARYGHSEIERKWRLG